MLGGKICPQHFLLILLVLKRRLVWVVLGIWKLSILLSTPNIREIWGFNSNLEPPTHNPHINGQICNILVLISAQFRQNKKLSSLCLKLRLNVSAGGLSFILCYVSLPSTKWFMPQTFHFHFIILCWNCIPHIYSALCFIFILLLIWYDISLYIRERWWKTGVLVHK